jgi:lysophospholipase L1-like esterase
MQRKRSSKRAGNLRRRKSNRKLSSAELRRAVTTGRAQAAEAFKIRQSQRRRRAAAIKRIQNQPAELTAPPPSIPSKTLAELGPAATAGVLMAEGDSWFDYPYHDVLKSLEDDHGYDVESVAHRGDRVEDMAFATGQLVDFIRRLEKLLRSGRVPKAILLSGGGNDIAGSELGMLLNHAQSPTPGLNEAVVAGVIDQRINVAYVAIITAITDICQRYLGHPIPIVTHGYDYAVPDGRGFGGHFPFMPGPWLEPSFREKGFLNRDDNTKTMKKLMDRFNEMLRSVVARPGFAHVRFVDLRGTLSIGSNYKTYWANELHPTLAGFRLVADKFALTIAAT